MARFSGWHFAADWANARSIALCTGTAHNPPNTARDASAVSCPACIEALGESEHGVGQPIADPSFTAEPDTRTGRVVYVVDGVGSFTVEPAEAADRPAGTSALVTFGDVGNREYRPLDVLPGAPVVNGCTLLGSVIQPAPMPTSPPWAPLRVLRSMEPHYAVLLGPRGEATVRQVLTAVLADWVARPDLAELRTAHEQWRAQFRLLDSACRVAAAEVLLAAARAEHDAAVTEERRVDALVAAFDERTGLSLR